MYNITATTENAKYECTTSDIDIALCQFFLSAKHDLSTRIIDSYTGELYVEINYDGEENYCTNEWRYILIGYAVNHEMGLDILWFVDDDD